MAGNLPVSILPQLVRAGGVFCIPDTFPVPSRDELRNLLEGALHGRKDNDEHLKEWMKLIAKDNVAKKPILRFGRLFLIQHYYRVLRHRHSRALHRKSKVVNEILMKFLENTSLKVSLKTIVSDVQFLQERLGRNWLERNPSWDIGPF